MPHKLKYLALFASCLSVTCFAAGDVKWGYEGAVGPDQWGDLSSEFAICKTGQMQAPIDIPAKSATQVQSPIKAQYKDTTAELINNGHTIQVSLPNGGGAVLDGVTYKIVQFHLHTPGEEKVDGKTYPFNAHMVHQSADGKLAVIGVFFKVGAESKGLKPILDSMPSSNGSVILKTPYDAASLLPKSLAYYSYQGSLTTPGCTEGVTFYILKEPVEMSAFQLKQFQKVFPMNARPVMPLNGRKITQGN